MLARKTAPAANKTQAMRAINSRCCSCASASAAISAAKVATAAGISIDKASPFSNRHPPGSMAPGRATEHANLGTLGIVTRNRSPTDAADGFCRQCGGRRRSGTGEKFGRLTAQPVGKKAKPLVEAGISPVQAVGEQTERPAKINQSARPPIDRTSLNRKAG
jgi:hypothetical protein